MGVEIGNKIFLYLLFFVLSPIMVLASWQENDNLGFESGNDTYWTFDWTGGGQYYNSLVTEDWSSQGTHSWYVAGAYGGLGVWSYHKAWAMHNFAYVNKGDMVCIDMKKNHSSLTAWSVYLSTGGTFMNYVPPGEYFDVCSISSNSGILGIFVKGRSDGCYSLGHCIAKFFIDNIRIYRCNDSTKNGDETDVDCGGRCDLCEIGKICKSNSDCSSHYCNENKTCAEPPNYSYYYNYNFEMGEPIYWNFGYEGGGQNYNSIITDQWASEGNHSLFVAGAYNGLGVWDYHKAWAIHNNTILEQGDTVCIDMKKNSSAYSLWKVYLYTNGSFLDSVPSGNYSNLCTQSAGSGNLGIVVQGRADECVDSSQCFAKFFIDNLTINIQNCSDGKLNRFETDIDCGGFCKKCLDGQYCNYNFDCQSNYCDNGTCFDSRCHNNIQDEGEKGIDCGGFCNPCVDCKSGTLNIATSTNGLNIRINNIYEGQTDYSYFLQKEINRKNCQNSYNVDIYCPDNVTLCYSETTYISNNGETTTVVESDCIKTCSTDANFWLTNNDVKINGNNINVTIHSSNINGNVDITMYRIHEETGLVDETKVLQTNIGSYSASSVATNWDLSSASALNIYIDESGEFDENKDDNFVYRLISRNIPNAYLSINTSYPEVDSLLKTYLEQYVESVSEGQEDLIISVGKFTDEFKAANPETLKPGGLFWWKKQGWGYKDNRINAYGKADSSSYAGIVGRTSYNGKPLVLTYGNRLDGDIASVKKLISARQLMFSDLKNEEKPPVLMDKYDRLALGVNNLLRGFTNYHSPQFLSVVNKILFDNAYDVAIRTVKTLDTTSYDESTILRLKNVNSDYSDDFKDAISENDKPVVLARGLWSNLFTWENFAKELVTEGRDSWLIEITGGPKQDCDTCPNYEYEDLVDYYWPALIAGVQQYSGEDNLDYVGFSNGCRVALDSLKSWSSTGKNNAGYYFNYDNGQYELTDLSSNPVDTFVAIGCPGAFEGKSFYSDCWKEYAEEMREIIGSKNHITPRDMGKALIIAAPFTDIKCELAGRLSSSNKGLISYNLADKYLNFIEDSTDVQPGTNINVDRFISIRGVIPIPVLQRWGIPLLHTKTDLVVTKEDMDTIYGNVNSNEKFYYKNYGAHTAPVNLISLADSKITESIIKDLVNGKDKTNYGHLLLNKTS